MINSVKVAQVILYVRNQAVSTLFYQCLFRHAPELDVPGMTEFQLNAHTKLGLMPNDGIARILAGQTEHPDTGTGIPRCELYLYVDDIEQAFENAQKCGAKQISPIMDRDWGDRACYFADPDGHIIAFAEQLPAGR